MSDRTAAVAVPCVQGVLYQKIGVSGFAACFDRREHNAGMRHDSVHFKGWFLRELWGE